ncbi:MAG: isochorismatase family protein [Parcubacteria group bacterium Gr01-1014_38]|nr:MAG: isochorismatase family protein [Parcubacteria group bacterium Gr01-1014_38]
MASSNPTALVVIDVQNCFVNKYTKKIPEKIARYIKRQKFDHVLFTTFVLNKRSNLYKLLHWKAFYSSPDTSIHKTVSPFANHQNTFPRSTYSVFKSRKFLSFLKRNKIKEVALCGIDSDGCVLASAFDAFDLGYNVHALRLLIASSGGRKFDQAAKVVMSRNLAR